METKSCLIVDDDEEVRLVLADLINRAKLFDSIVHAKDGVEASFKTQMQKFTTIITDIDMPRKNGIVFVEESLLLQRTEAHRIIIMSALMDSDYIPHLKTIGVNKMLVKPFSSGRLHDLIKSTWEKAPVSTPKHKLEGNGLRVKLVAQ